MPRLARRGRNFYGKNYPWLGGGGGGQGGGAGEFGGGPNILHFLGAGQYQWNVRTDSFNVVDSAWNNGVQVISPGTATLDFTDDDGATYPTYAFGAPDPAKTEYGSDWCELQGWISSAKKLWYVANWIFYPGKPYCWFRVEVVDKRVGENRQGFLSINDTCSGTAGNSFVTLTGASQGRYLAGDRVHIESNGVYGITSFAGQQVNLDGALTTTIAAKKFRYWEIRKVKNLSIRVGASGGTAKTTRQWNSYYWDDVGSGQMDMYGVAGSEVRWSPFDIAAALQDAPDEAILQGLHSAGTGNDSAGTPLADNRMEWYPKLVGDYKLSFLYKGFASSSRNSDAVTIDVVHTGGTYNEPSFAQGTGEQVKDLNAGANFNLDLNSKVIIRATGTSGRYLVVKGIRVKDTGGATVKDMVCRRHDGQFASSGVASWVRKWFFEQHSGQLVRTSGQIGFDGILDEQVVTGGIGFAHESAIVMGLSTTEAYGQLYDPPASPVVPGYLTDFDVATVSGGTLGTQFDAALTQGRTWWPKEKDKRDNYGLRNFGDFKDKASHQANGLYSIGWYNGQYDLARYFAHAWLRTGNADHWKYWQETLQHHATIDTVKFSPFIAKYNGAGYRKGDFEMGLEHNAGAEPLPEYTYSPETLMLLWENTGQRVPWYKEVAKMSVDHVAERATNGTLFYSRSTGKNEHAFGFTLHIGEYYWPSDPTYNYHNLYQSMIDQMVNDYDAQSPVKRLYGMQPVWVFQKIEMLCRWHALGNSGPAGKPALRDVILSEVKRHYLDSYALNLQMGCRNTSRHRSLASSQRMKSSATYRFIVYIDGSLLDSEPVESNVLNWTDPTTNAWQRVYVSPWVGVIAYAYSIGYATRATTLAASGTTVTVTDTAHALVTGQSAVIQNASDPLFENGRHVVTVVDANSYSYPVASAPPATGTADVNSDKTVLYLFFADVWQNQVLDIQPTQKDSHNLSFLGFSHAGVSKMWNQ